MTFKTLFKEEHCEIIQVGPHAIKIKFSGFLKVANLAAVTSFMDTFTKQNPCDLLLVDHFELKVLSKEVQEYLTKVIAVISGKGIKRLAIIKADDIFAKAGFEKIHKEVHTDSIEYATFHSEKDAMEWLLSTSVNPVL
jgi:hypothetical protein